ncbi:MAG: histidine kinase dimerization/phospho-acceptor domain-containing protein, partial [Candidatus Nitrosocosmicus sp.]
NLKQENIGYASDKNKYNSFVLEKNDSKVDSSNKLIEDNDDDFNEKTIVVYGEDETTIIILKVLNNSIKRWDNYANSKGPTIAMGLERLRKGMENAFKRGVKIRYLTEINNTNIDYCKQLMKVADLRHLDNAKGGMAVNESEYIATAHLKEAKPVSHLIYSNVKEIVEQQQLVFESLWSRSTPGEHKIKEIEEGIEPIKTRVLENQEEIYNHFMRSIKKSNERYACWSIDGMQLVYSNFFNLYKDIIARQKKGEGNGIKWLTYIDNNKNSIQLVKTFLDAGIQIRHIKNFPSMNFSFDSNSIQITIEKMKYGNFMNRLLISNEPNILDHFTSYFQELWNNFGVDAKERIKDIEEGMEYDIEVIRHSDRALNKYMEIIKSSQTEIFFIFPTPKAFIRQLKLIKLANQASKERTVKVRILTPTNDAVEKFIYLFLKEQKQEEIEKQKKQVHINSNESIASFSNTNNSNSDIQIRYIEKMSNTKDTILITDRKESLVMELKDDTKDTFIEAVGQSIHLTSKASVLSYVAIFENLWKQSELYQEIKESNEKLKNNDRMQKEFINTAAHELRTPLQPIISLSQLLKSKAMDEEHQNKSLGIIFNNARKLKKLTEDILDVTKIEADRLNLNKEIFIVKDVVQSTIKEIKEGLDYNKKIKFDLQFKNIDPGFTLIADQNRISQVISNLISNSIKFISKKEREGQENDHSDGIISIQIEKIDPVMMNNDKNSKIGKIIF